MRAVCIIVFLAVALIGSAFADDGLRTIEDRNTGIKIAIPVELLPTVKESKWGRAWMSQDRAFKIDIFSMSPKKLEEVYENIKGVKGRTAKSDEKTTTSFALEGHDADGSHFKVVAHQIADAVKGFSIVFEKNQMEARRRLVGKIAESFEPALTAEFATQPPALATPLKISDVTSGTALQVYGFAKGDKLNIRELANAKSAILAELPDGTVGLTASGRASQNEDDTWLEVNYGNKRGWVNARFVRKLGQQNTVSINPTAVSKAAEKPNAPPTDPIADCNSEDRERKLRGCEVLINNAALSAQIRSLALSRRADSYLALGDFERSVSDLTEADKLQADDLTKKRLSFVYLMRGLSHGRDKKNDDAIADYNQAISVDANNDQAYLARANAYADQGKIDDAISDLATRPNFMSINSDAQSLLVDLYKRRALSRLQEQHYNAAEDDCIAAINFAPERLDLYLLRGSVQIARKEPKAAIADAEIILAKDAKNIQALLLRAEARAMLSDYFGAAADYSSILKEQPKNSTALLSRALTYERLEKFSNAEADYKTALRLNPKNENARRNLNRLAYFVKWHKSRD